MEVTENFTWKTLQSNQLNQNCFYITSFFLFVNSKFTLFCIIYMLLDNGADFFPFNNNLNEKVWGFFFANIRTTKNNE